MLSGKGNELFVGHIVLDAVKIIRHLQHRLYKAFGQQPSHERSCAAIISTQLRMMAGMASS